MMKGLGRGGTETQAGGFEMRRDSISSCEVSRRGSLLAMALLFLLALGGATPVAAQLLSLPHSATVPLTSLVDEAVFTIDMDTLPARPRMTSLVTPDASHPDLQVETEWVCNLSCFLGSGLEDFPPCEAGSSCVSDESLSLNVYKCAPFGPWTGQTCDVHVRVLDFGAAGVPANVDVEIEGVTVPLTNTQSLEFDTTPQPTSISFGRNRDTTIYEEAASGSNGQGEYIWAGTDVTLGFPNVDRDERRGLITFDVGGFGSPIPQGATIDDAELILNATSSLGLVVNVSVTPVADAGGLFFSDWYSGDANASGSEFSPGFGTLQAATWVARSYPFSPWATPGGSPDGPPVATVGVLTAGPISFQSPALTAVIEDMWSIGNDGNGLLLRDATGGIPIADRGVQFASGENPDPSLRPELIVTYTPAAPPPVGADIVTQALPFIGEGEDFRWIYDTSVTDSSLDGRVTTFVGGECTVTDTSNPQFLPYEYDFAGDPAYQGLDCCTWQILSQGNFGDPDDDIVGTGQALFFINVDSSDPANFPGDLDGDGILDLCDNCMWRPNGPAGGTCVGGPTEGIICNTNEECGAGGVCQLSQEDADGDFLGDACLVPEPGFGLMLSLGVMGLGRLSRARTKRVPR